MRVPSGERSNHQWPSFESISKRASSRPRPCNGSRVVMITCLRSSIGSAIAHKSEEDRAQRIMPSGLAVNRSCDGPPLMGTRMTGSPAASWGPR